MNDLRGYTDAELSMLVFNTERYYNVLMQSLLDVRELLQEDEVLYTPDQWGMLCRDYFDALDLKQPYELRLQRGIIMRNITRHAGTVEKVKRLDSSVNGNPRFSFTIDGYTAVTGVDATHGYEIQNFEGKNCVAYLGSHYGKLTLNSITESE